jgi:hypothetical protein
MQSAILLPLGPLYEGMLRSDQKSGQIYVRTSRSWEVCCQILLAAIHPLHLPQHHPLATASQGQPTLYHVSSSASYILF